MDELSEAEPVMAELDEIELASTNAMEPIKAVETFDLISATFNEAKLKAAEIFELTKVGLIEAPFKTVELVEEISVDSNFDEVGLISELNILVVDEEGRLIEDILADIEFFKS